MNSSPACGWPVTVLSRLLAIPLVALVGCTAIRPALPPDQVAEVRQPFSHEDFDRVLHRFVDDQGRVDYAALKQDSGDLDRYFAQIASYSPDSHPELFPTEHSKLAYWINAYNAAVMETVLTYYPIASVTDVTTPFPIELLTDKAGFFVFQRVTFGDQTTSLYALEHDVVRDRFEDSRIHFALNCASGGCPRLPMHAFTAEHLDEQLGVETRKFFAEDRHLAIDHDGKVVYLSSILDWYEDDFLEWNAVQLPSENPTLLDYAALYVPADRAQEPERAQAYEIRFVPYGWDLNDQNRSR